MVEEVEAVEKIEEDVLQVLGLGTVGVETVLSLAMLV
jgi:hypothetical protein